MEQNSSQNAERPLSQPQTPATLLQALQLHAQTQAATHQIQIPAGSMVPPSPSPAPVVHAPSPEFPDNVRALAALNFHMHQQNQAQTPAHQPVSSNSSSSHPTPQSSTPAPEVSKTAKGKAKVEKKVVSRKTGKGARSGKNARASGHSESEIDLLTEEQRNDADIIEINEVKIIATWDDESSIKLAEYIATPERWAKVQVSLRNFCQEISQNILPEYTAEQCLNRWHSIFRQFKDTRRWEKHTGGGDGDESVSDLRTSAAQCKKFAEGPIYPIILRVAEGRADIDRSIEFSSSRKFEDVEAEVKQVKEEEKKRKKGDAASEFTAIMSEAIFSQQERQKESTQLDAERFAYERAKDEKEEEFRRKRMRSEDRATKIQEMRNMEDLRRSKLEQYRQMRDSDDPVEQDLAVDLAEEIRDIGDTIRHLRRTEWQD
ncbi:uncharacterized protein FOMMEDRAFT_162986 [Fomitiporia mediterranea MF3/22]|uniref:Myb-like domain-containing protein n=1 Tax=Fomitiporia mediterranea (strain MF3/22) TaxID=694068 RepID=R7SFN7_FOMME|nr:uncharacterized protein FOMMEDRAFT_151899 [Fomitiporia mediterranea MF3/22]XP_007272214.1 uncharacterized protein FOMMEDRAFT_162986 [Fomitiporia mediterranea MF3/22]EJC97523.1 hypothetical protein FOMMEDRAFT_162986 [Fomitiporia mediterranea MF3/22]EJD06617.1 hypothetical protein FOMMEDRAFT_151899 [Fomitiporia mediterranea MF3/22]